MESTEKLHEQQSFGERLRFVRDKFGQSLEAFGVEIGYDKSYLSRLESGKVANPSVEFIEAVCEKFLVSREWLEAGKGNAFVAHTTEPIDYRKIMSHMSLAARGFEAMEKDISTIRVVSLLLDGLALREKLQKLSAIIDDDSIATGAKPFWLKVILASMDSDRSSKPRIQSGPQVFHRSDCKTPVLPLAKK